MDKPIPGKFPGCWTHIPKEIRTLFNNTVIAIDSSIKKGKHGEILVYENGKLYASDPSGKRRLLF